MLLWNQWGRRKKKGAVTNPEVSNADALKELEERIRPNLGNPNLLSVYRKEAERLRELSDDELVYIDCVDSGRGAATELARRSMEATRGLKHSLDSANNRIYWLTAVLGFYTVLLVIATLVLVFKTR